MSPSKQHLLMDVELSSYPQSLINIYKAHPEAAALNYCSLPMMLSLTLTIRSMQGMIQHAPKTRLKHSLASALSCSAGPNGPPVELRCRLISLMSVSYTQPNEIKLPN